MSQATKQSLLEANSTARENEIKKNLYDYANDTNKREKDKSALERIFDAKTILTPI
jgi:hypothetical protein